MKSITARFWDGPWAGKVMAFPSPVTHFDLAICKNVTSLWHEDVTADSGHAINDISVGTYRLTGRIVSPGGPRPITTYWYEWSGPLVALDEPVVPEQPEQPDPQQSVAPHTCAHRWNGSSRKCQQLPATQGQHNRTAVPTQQGFTHDD